MAGRGGDLGDGDAVEEMMKDLDSLRRKGEMPLPKRWSEWDEIPESWKEAFKLRPDRVRDVLRKSVDEWRRLSEATGASGNSPL